MTAYRSFHLRQYVPHALAIVIAGAACFGIALWAKARVEAKSISDIELVLGQTGNEWAEATADGLQVSLFGTAPDEATRFSALSTAGTVVDASRIRDNMAVAATAEIAAPKFSVEILKNEDGLSLIGLVPVESDAQTIIERARQISGAEKVTDLIESADFAPPPGWERALSFGLNALDDLPRSKVSITPRQVAITAVAEDATDKQRIERTLRRAAPSGISLALNITAPRPVISPFTIRFLIDESGARFDACSADSEGAREAILAAAINAGLVGKGRCPLGLGTPSTRWGDAAVQAIDALKAIGSGTLTISNADITIMAAEGTPQSVFDRQVGELEGQLPAVFSLNAVLLESPEDPSADTIIPEFVATRSPEGLVQMRGRLGSELTRSAVESFAAAHFGAANVYPAARIVDGLPAGWPTRVLTALESLALLNHGTVVVTPDSVEISGISGRQDARAGIARILSSKLEEGAKFSLDVTYSEALDPLAALPTPEECVAQINVAVSKQKIVFAPSSTDIEPAGMETIDAISDLLRNCQTVNIEIGGHTDSQGREEMNQQLSQARADAVLNEIMTRRVLTSNLRAKGYGEVEPIADNKTENGREANRRIEFRLVLPEAVAEDHNEGHAETIAAPEGESE
jgi:OOP family OmpA-OmpF porin